MNDDNKNIPPDASSDEKDINKPIQNSDESCDNDTIPNLNDTDTIESELEDLADIFREEYKKAKAEDEAENGEDSNSNADGLDAYDPVSDIYSHEYSHTETAVTEELLCECCHVNMRDISEIEDNVYCADCRRILLKHPFSIQSILVFIATPLLILTSLLYSIAIFPYSVNIAYADKLERQGNLSEALYEYNTIISDAESSFDSFRASRKMIELLYKTGQLNYIKSYFSELNPAILKLPMYSYLNDINLKSTAITDTFSACGSAVSEFFNQDTGEVIFDDAIAALNNYEATLDTSAKYYNLQKSAVAYYKYYMVYAANRSLDEAINYLSPIKELVPDEVWLYAYPLGHALARSGQLEAALEISKTMQKFDASDPNYAIIEAAAYRRQADYDKALAICDAAIVEGGDDASYTIGILRQKAIVLLLQDKAGEAVSLLEDIYQNYLSFEICDTLAICALAAEDIALYDEIAGIYDAQSVELGDKVKGFKDGTLSVEQIFLEDLADVRL